MSNPHNPAAKAVRQHTAFAPIRRNRAESHTPESLALRLGVPVSVGLAMVERQIVRALPLTRQNNARTMVFESNELNAVLAEVGKFRAQTVVAMGGDESAVHAALLSHAKLFCDPRRATEFVFNPRREEEEPSTLAKLGKAAAVAAGAAAVGSYVRGRVNVGGTRAGKMGIVNTTAHGAGLLKKDATAAIGAAGRALLKLAKARALARTRK